MSYSDELKHPKWQRRRLEILSRANFACEKCAADDKPLHVHHKLYRAGAQPWEYADDELVSLCETCHAHEHVPIYTGAQMDAVMDQLKLLAGAVEKLQASIEYLESDRWEQVKEIDRLTLKVMSEEQRQDLKNRKAAAADAVRKVAVIG